MAGPSDHMANERTFLAWMRTGIALMGFGFVIVKFALFLRQITFVLGEETTLGNKGMSAEVGIAMVGLGALVAVGSLWNYFRVKRQLESDNYLPSKLLPLLLTFIVVVGSLMLLFYLLPNIQQPR